MEFHNFTWFVYTIRLVLYLQKKSSLGFVTRFDPALLKRRLGSETITRKKIIIEKKQTNVNSLAIIFYG